MENNREVIKELEHNDEMEQAYCILLLLCREYSLKMINNIITKEECFAKIKQIREDIKQLDKQELIRKTNKLYRPMLQMLKDDNSKYGKSN